MFCYFSSGNNDLELDYLPPVTNHSEYYKKLYYIFEPCVFPKGSDVDVLNSREKFKTTFELGGYYSIILDGKYINCLWKFLWSCIYTHDILCVHTRAYECACMYMSAVL